MSNATTDLSRQLILVPIDRDGDVSGACVRFPADWESLRDTIDLTHATTSEALEAWESAMATADVDRMVYITHHEEPYSPPTVTIDRQTFIAMLEWVDASKAVKPRINRLTVIISPRLVASGNQAAAWTTTQEITDQVLEALREIHDDPNIVWFDHTEAARAWLGSHNFPQQMIADVAKDLNDIDVHGQTLRYNENWMPQIGDYSTIELLEQLNSTRNGSGFWCYEYFPNTGRWSGGAWYSGDERPSGGSNIFFFRIRWADQPEYTTADIDSAVNQRYVIE